MDVESIYLSVLGGTLLWFNLQFLLDVSGIAARLGPFINAKSTYAFAGLYLAYLYYVHPHSDNHECFYTAFIVLSAGFYLFHMFYVRRFLVLLHHVATSTVLCYVLRFSAVDTALGNLAVFILTGSLVTEPLILLRRLLKRVGAYSGAIKEGISWCFALSFSTVRLAGWCVQIGRYCLTPDADGFIEVLLAVIFLLSIAFSYRIMKMAFHGSL